MDKKMPHDNRKNYHRAVKKLIRLITIYNNVMGLSSGKKGTYGIFGERGYRSNQR
jgi:hypothetical protein